VRWVVLAWLGGSEDELVVEILTSLNVEVDVVMGQ
jgi:hypothetical protein